MMTPNKKATGICNKTLTLNNFFSSIYWIIHMFTERENDEYSGWNELASQSDMDMF